MKMSRMSAIYIAKEIVKYIAKEIVKYDHKSFYLFLLI